MIKHIMYLLIIIVLTSINLDVLLANPPAKPQNVTINVNSANIHMDKAGNVCISENGKNVACNYGGATSNTNVPSSKGSHTGYCTLLPIYSSNEIRILNDRCLITKYGDSYKLKWSSGRIMNITIGPPHSIDGESGRLIENSSTSATLKTESYKIGFCWNCKP